VTGLDTIFKDTQALKVVIAAWRSAAPQKPSSDQNIDRPIVHASIARERPSRVSGRQPAA